MAFRLAGRVLLGGGVVDGLLVGIIGWGIVCLGMPMGWLQGNEVIRDGRKGEPWRIWCPASRLRE